MFRIIRDLLSLLCLPLLLVIVLMWARSYIMIDRLVYRSDGQDCRLRSDSGHVTYFWTTPLFPDKPMPTHWLASDLPPGNPLVDVWESIGFHHEFRQTAPDLLGHRIQRSLTMIPYWSLAMIAGILPGWRIWDYRRRGVKV